MTFLCPACGAPEPPLCPEGCREAQIETARRARPRVVYAAGIVHPAELGPVYVHIGLTLPETRIGPARLFVVSGAPEFEARPEVRRSLVAQAWERLNALDAAEIEKAAA